MYRDNLNRVTTVTVSSLATDFLRLPKGMSFLLLHFFSLPHDSNALKSENALLLLFQSLVCASCRPDNVVNQITSFVELFILPLIRRLMIIASLHCFLTPSQRLFSLCNNFTCPREFLFVLSLLYFNVLLTHIVSVKPPSRQPRVSF